MTPQESVILCAGADPWVVSHEGRFIYCHAHHNGVAVRVAETLEGIGDARVQVIWKAPDSGPYSKEIWAPELHFYNDRWYVYVAADDGDNANHRMIALHSDTLLGPYDFAGPLALTPDRWAIDGTLLALGEQLYFVWSGWEGQENVAQHLYICPMQDPLTPSGERMRISSPEYAWETRGSGGPGNLPAINEGPQVLQRNGITHLIYSAAGSWCDDYCLGRLTLAPGANPLDADAWKKHPEPVFQKTERVFGPGHCSFVDNWIVYHSARSSGSGWDRVIRAQKFTWDGDVPNFGRPH
jgi:GH43 family beta-xylosidase